MDAADCIVIQPGGLTTSESLAKGLPRDYYQSHTRAGRTECRILLNNGLALMVSETFLRMRPYSFDE